MFKGTEKIKHAGDIYRLTLRNGGRKTSYPS